MQTHWKTCMSRRVYWADALFEQPGVTGGLGRNCEVKAGCRLVHGFAKP